MDKNTTQTLVSNLIISKRDLLQSESVIEKSKTSQQGNSLNDVRHPCQI